MQEQLNIPRHIAIIMDGNGRWAKKRMMPRSFGHKAGVETVHRIVEHCSDIGVEALTLYAFSTENWKRSEEEVGALMQLFRYYILCQFRSCSADLISSTIIDCDHKGKSCIILCLFFQTVDAVNNILGKTSSVTDHLYPHIVGRSDF